MWNTPVWWNYWLCGIQLSGGITGCVEYNCLVVVLLCGIQLSGSSTVV